MSLSRYRFVLSWLLERDLPRQPAGYHLSTLNAPSDAFPCFHSVLELALAPCPQDHQGLRSSCIE